MRVSFQIGAAVVASTLLACGGAAPPAWAGTWQASSPASSVELTLSGSGTAIGGSGVELVSGASSRAFTVSGASEPVPGMGVTFTYADDTTEGFVFSQPDANHLILANPSRTLSFSRR